MLFKSLVIQLAVCYNRVCSSTGCIFHTSPFLQVLCLSLFWPWINSVSETNFSSFTFILLGQHLCYVYILLTITSTLPSHAKWSSSGSYNEINVVAIWRKETFNSILGVIHSARADSENTQANSQVVLALLPITKSHLICFSMETSELFDLCFLRQVNTAFSSVKTANNCYIIA